MAEQRELRRGREEMKDHFFTAPALFLRHSADRRPRFADRSITASQRQGAFRASLIAIRISQIAAGCWLLKADGRVHIAARGWLLTAAPQHQSSTASPSGRMDTCQNWRAIKS